MLRKIPNFIYLKFLNLKACIKKKKFLKKETIKKIITFYSDGSLLEDSRKASS